MVRQFKTITDKEEIKQYLRSFLLDVDNMTSKHVQLFTIKRKIPFTRDILFSATLFHLTKMEIIKVTKEYFETEDEKVYFFEPLEKEISVEDMQKIVYANEKLIKEIKNAKN